MESDLFDVHEAAEFLKVSVSCLNQWRCKGKGPVYSNATGKIIYTLDDLKAFLRSGQVTPRPKS